MSFLLIQTPTETHEMEQVVSRLSGAGVTKLVVGLGDLCSKSVLFVEKGTAFIDKGIDVVDHIAEMTGDACDALKAYAVWKTLDIRVRNDEEILSLEKKVLIQELRSKQSGLDRKRTTLERDIKKLETRKANLEKMIEGEVRRRLKNGTAEVKPTEGASMSDGRIQPLTHHMKMPQAVSTSAK